MIAINQRFATIDLNSGYVWWVGDAQSAAEACQKADADSTCEPRQFEEVPQAHIAHASYAVYAVPTDFDVNDGQDPAQIAAVESHKRVGLFAEI